MTICEAKPAPTWGWAVVEIRPDETWGEPVVVPAAGAAEAIATATSAASPQPASADLDELTPTIQAHLGSLHLANGDLHQAIIALTRGTHARSSSEARDVCVGRLAHAEAILGDLRRASRHAGQVRTSPLGTLRTGAAHAHLARAWIALERTDLGEVRRHLDIVARTPQPDHDQWLHTSVLVVEASVLLLTGQPDAAIRLLAARSDPAAPATPADWLVEMVKIVRAQALLASGEPQRALAVVTPAPSRAGVHAAVVAAAARRTIGDFRGAQAVLSGAVADLERAPLSLQIEAWLLEARLAEDRGKADRARLLVDRALRMATTERMRRPLTRDWRWLRTVVDGDAALLRSHREFLSTCRTEVVHALRKAPDNASGPHLVAPLTEREGQVLDLLAQMYSTEEIAALLYVSSNTVKTHLKGIFGKLCVNRRVEAVRRGRQLGLC